jgi:hypothetical protein
MKWWQRVLQRYVPPVERVETRIQSVFLPLGMRVTTQDYLEACQRVMTTNDGKILLAAHRERFLGAMTMKCPHKEADQRLAWLAGHEMLMAVRKEILDELERNVELIPEAVKMERLRGLRTHEGDSNG